MSEQYKLLHPVKYYRDHLNCNLRPDGREFDKFRPIAINVGSITTADGSSIVKVGNTTVVCGIRAELAKPKAEEPENGYLVPSIELLPICTRRHRPTSDNTAVISGGGGGGGAGGVAASKIGQNLPKNVEDAEVYTCALNDILLNSNCVNLKDLCIYKEKLVWVLYCDISCLDHDGCVVDAALIAIITALKNLKLPKINYDADINKISVDEKTKNKLNINSNPISTTFITFEENIIITDPTREEEDLSSSTITIGINDSKVCYVLKPGGTPLNQEQMDTCIQQALLREQFILELINNVFKKHESQN